MANRQQQYAKEGETNATPSVDGAQVEQVKAFAKEGEEGISTVSHTASAPDSTVATVSPALALLQSQLDDLRTTSAATQARLEAEVEELQARKRDEDAVRTELKARTKVLEENKREAESERLDAEKKLIAARSIKKSVEDRVTKARSELSKLEKKEKEVQEKIVRSREERRAKLDSLREDVKQREAILMKEEEATEKLNKRVADLEREIEERKNDLFHFRREEANAAAQAVTNRMNRAGRGLGSGTGGANAPGTGAHSHAHGPHSGAATTAKRHMHPANHAAAAAHSHAQAHRHPSQHPNAAVPIAYPYINSEDQQGKQASGHARAASPSPPVGDGGNAQSHAPSAGNAPGDGQTFGSSFMEHRLQSRRAASAASGLGQSAVISANQPVSSSMNTSVIGNSASAANALYNRQQLDRTDENGDDEEDVDEERKAVFGSTFAPFGPASPTSPSTIGAPSPREQHAFIKMNGSSPSLAHHMPYFASDKAIQQEQQNNASRLRMSTSREEFLAAIRAETDGDGNGVDLHATPVIGLAHELAVDDSEAYATTQPRAIIGASGRKDGRSGSGGLRRESFDSVGSFTSSNGGPLSPMTPHQASLIPSQLFDMLDDVEMPASPTPFNAQMQEPHHAFTQGISDAFEHADELLDVQDRQQNQHVVPRRTSGMYSPWADFDMDAGFDFDKPLGYGNSASAEVSRKPSGREVDLLRRRRSGSSLNGSSAHHGDDGKQGEGIFASYGPTHGHHGSVGSTGQRSNTSSSGGSISPSLAAAAQGQQQQNPNVAGNNLPPGFGKLSPNDLLFDKARHVLSLNPDAKAFSFNRPLPSSGSAGSLNSIGGGAAGNSRTGLPSNATAGAIGDARLAFDSAAGVTAGSGFHLPGGDSPVLSNGTAIGQPGTSTWASPNLASRGLHHNLGYGSSTNLANAGLRESTRSASGPPLTTSNTGGHTFSPFDDDDLLKGW